MSGPEPPEPAYRLEEQVGFILRQVNQRHAGLFASAFGDDLTPMQWAALAKLAELGECSQNLLGRHVSMDVATAKGVVDRLVRRGFVETRRDPDDRRRILVSASPAGLATVADFTERALDVSRATLDPLAPAERKTLLDLLRKLR